MTEKKLDELLSESLSGDKSPSDELKNKLKTSLYETDRRSYFMKRNFLTGIKATAAGVAAFVLCIGVAANVSSTACLALEKIPVIGAITKVITFRTFEDKTGDFEAYLEIPEISGLDGVNDEINKRIGAYANELIQSYETGKAETGAEGHYAMTSGYSVLGDNEQYFSVKVWTNIVMAGAQEFNKFFVVDKKSEKILEFTDFFPTQDKMDALKSSIEDRMNTIMQTSDSLSYFPEFLTIDENTKFYINNRNDFVISFDKYEVAPGCMGVQEFTVGTVKDGKFVPTDGEIAEGKKISGVVEDATMSTVTIRTEDGKTYSFLKDGAEMMNYNQGLLVGDGAEITYFGTLDETKTAQDVTVARVASYRLSTEQ